MNSVVVLRHVPYETLGVIDQALHEAGLAWHYVDLFDTTVKSLDLSNAPGLIILGGPMNVDEVDKYPYLVTELDWIRDAVDRELPILGICFGSQMLAKALGGTVYKNPSKEIGWYPIELTQAVQQDALMKGCSSRQIVYQFHGDTFTLPTGAVHLARSPLCENQAFRFGRNAYGLQFHVEVTPEMATGWLDQPGNRCMIAELDAIDPDQIRRDTPHALAQMHSFSQAILSRFAILCTQRI